MSRAQCFLCSGPADRVQDSLWVANMRILVLEVSLGPAESSPDQCDPARPDPAAAAAKQAQAGLILYSSSVRPLTNQYKLSQSPVLC